MPKIDFDKIKREFDGMTAQEQYNWLVTTDLKDRFTVMLDNDGTDIFFDDDEEANYILTFKWYIGNSGGAEALLTAIGCNIQGV